MERILAAVALLAAAACGAPPAADAGDAQGGDRDAVAESGSDAVAESGSDASPTPDDGAPRDAPADASDGGRRRGTGTITGTVNGAGAMPMDVVFQPSAACGGAAGIYLATSGTPVTCANPLAGELRQPYIQMRLASRAPGTYRLVPEGMCTGTTTDRVFTASFNAEGMATFDGATGTIEVTASSAEEVTGRLDITFGSPAAGTLTGTFTATACPP